MHSTGHVLHRRLRPQGPDLGHRGRVQVPGSGRGCAVGHGQGGRRRHAGPGQHELWTAWPRSPGRRVFRRSETLRPAAGLATGTASIVRSASWMRLAAPPPSPARMCTEWAGGISDPGYAIQGNILAGPEVVRQMETDVPRNRAATCRSACWPPSRPATVPAATDEGRQSAAIYGRQAAGGYGGYNDRWIDYREDDDLNPIPRLRRAAGAAPPVLWQEPQARSVCGSKDSLVQGAAAHHEGPGLLLAARTASTTTPRARPSGHSSTMRTSKNGPIRTPAGSTSPVLDYLLKKLK